MTALVVAFTGCSKPAPPTIPAPESTEPTDDPVLTNPDISAGRADLPSAVEVTPDEDLNVDPPIIREEPVGTPEVPRFEAKEIGRSEPNSK
jgi:hypothetical protein